MVEHLSQIKDRIKVIFNVGVKDNEISFLDKRLRLES